MKTQRKTVFNIFTLFALLTPLIGNALAVTPAYAASDNPRQDVFCTLREMVIAANSTDGSTIHCRPLSIANGTITFTLSNGEVHVDRSSREERRDTIAANGSSASLFNAQAGPTFVVNTTADTDDTSCDTLGSGIGNQDCTLREAIDAAYFDSGANTIVFDNALGTATITLTSDLPDIGDAGGFGLTINGGSDITIDGDDLYRPFYVCGCGALTLDSITVTNGNAAVDAGGGLLNESGEVTIINSTFSGNSADAGGAILNDFGRLTIVNSTFSGNSTIYEGGAIVSYLGIVTITNSTFSGNSAASGEGGAIFNIFGLTTITRSTFSGNSAFGVGAILNVFGTLVVTNSTLTDNSATDEDGGGIYNIAGTLTITNSTLSNNTAPLGDGGSIFNDDGTLYLYNTILANSPSGADCFNLSGTVAGNNNLIETDAAGSNACGTTSPINNIDPQLGVLTGSPAYHPLNFGSPAINAGHAATCEAAPVSSTSQNGASRSPGQPCDIGSFEMWIYFFPYVPK